MGQKVNPVAFRTGVMEGWKSRWYAKTGDLFATLLVEDKKIRDFVGKHPTHCLLYTSPSPRDGLLSRMPSSA